MSEQIVLCYLEQYQTSTGTSAYRELPKLTHPNSLFALVLMIILICIPRFVFVRRTD
jgi:hypothetical protein